MQTKTLAGLTLGLAVAVGIWLSILAEHRRVTAEVIDFAERIPVERPAEYLSEAGEHGNATADPEPQRDGSL